MSMRVLASAQDSGKVVSTHKSCRVTKEEADVYTFFLKSETASNRLTVLVNSTEARDYGVDSLNLQLAAQGRGIPPDARADFTAKNKSSCLLEGFPRTPNLRFVSKSEINAIFAVGWAEFHKRYGHGSEVVTVSRVGFNSDKTLALLHVIGAVSRDGAAGEFYVLERKNSGWQIKFYIQTVAV
jgi:hypothetical protein